jgi:hypothetical protein
MGKTNWMRVFLGGLLAGVVLNILGYITWVIYLGKAWDPALEALNPAFEETVGVQIFWIVFYFVLGILAVWLYSAMRPRYGAGAKTAVIAGLAVWVLNGLSFAAVMASFGLLPASLLVVDSLTFLVTLVIATLVGAWVYKEQPQ